MDDIPGIGNEPPLTVDDKKRAVVSYASFFQRVSGKMRDAAQAYANKKAQVSGDTLDHDPRVAQRVVTGATFVPAHPSRMRVLGRSNGPKFKYFVVHRPIGLPLENVGKVNPGSARKETYTLQRLVEWAINSASVPQVVSWFRQYGTPACSQFVMGLDGQLIQMVDLCDIAYQVRDLTHPRTGEPVTNGNSVGIELEGFVEPFDQKQIAKFTAPGEREKMKSGFPFAMKQKLAWLLRWFHDNPSYGMPLDTDHVLLHSDLDPSRRTDPGYNFRDVLVEVLALAAAAAPITSFWAPPVDLVAAEDVAAKRFGAMLGYMSGPYAELVRSAGSGMQSASRASAVRQTGRGAYFSAAVEHNAKLVAARAEDVASRLSSETGYLAATLNIQKNRSGLSFDFTTGTWNDVG